jgi:hypothetical protein
MPKDPYKTIPNKKSDNPIIEWVNSQELKDSLKSPFDISLLTMSRELTDFFSKRPPNLGNPDSYEYRDKKICLTWNLVSGKHTFEFADSIIFLRIDDSEEVGKILSYRDDIWGLIQDGNSDETS